MSVAHGSPARMSHGWRAPGTTSLYVVPIHVDLDGDYFYGYATLGQKIEWMATKPACLCRDRRTEERTDNGRASWYSDITRNCRDTPRIRRSAKGGRAPVSKAPDVVGARVCSPSTARERRPVDRVPHSHQHDDGPARRPRSDS